MKPIRAAMFVFLVVLAATFIMGGGTPASRIAARSNYYEKAVTPSNHPDARRGGPVSTVRGKTNDKEAADDRAPEQPQRRELNDSGGFFGYLVNGIFHVVYWLDFFDLIPDNPVRGPVPANPAAAILAPTTSPAPM